MADRMDRKPAAMQYLKDNRRFIWESERNGWRNYYLYDLSGKQLAVLTNNTSFESANIVKVDETAGVMYYMARDGDNYMKMQLHRVGLDGKGDVRLTDPKYNHSVGNCGGAAGEAAAAHRLLRRRCRTWEAGGGCGISPDNKFVVEVYQTHDQPASTQIIDASGKVLTQLANADTTKFDSSASRRSRCTHTKQPTARRHSTGRSLSIEF